MFSETLDEFGTSVHCDREFAVKSTFLFFLIIKSIIFGI